MRNVIIPFPTVPRRQKTPTMQFAKRLLSVIGMAAALGLAGQPAAAQETRWPRTIGDGPLALTLKSPPKRIVSTTPSVTGILLAIGAPVVASAATTPSLFTDGKGFFSQWASVADAHGVAVLYPSLKFDIEAVIGANPDLAITSVTGADSVLQHRAALEAQGIPTLLVNYSDRSWQDLAMELGRATGLERQAADAVSRFDAEVAGAAAKLAPPRSSVSIVGYNIGGSYSVARLSSPVAKLIAALGFDIVALPAALRANSARPSDFEFFSRENLSAVISGETVFLLRATEKDVQAFLAEPVLANHPAVIKRQVYPLGPTSHRIDPYSGRQIIERMLGSFGRP